MARNARIHTCPYYHHSQEKSITCEGCARREGEAAPVFRVRHFEDKSDCFAWQDRYCCDEWGECNS